MVTGNVHNSSSSVTPLPIAGQGNEESWYEIVASFQSKK